MSLIPNVKNQGGDLQLEDHACLFYNNREDWEYSILSYYCRGMERGEKCVYICSHSTPNDIINAFISNSVDIDTQLEDKSFLIMRKDETYCKDNDFEPLSMIKFLIRETQKALEQGFKGLRISGEMTWSLNFLKSPKKLLEYESKLNSQVFQSNAISALCQYDLTKFSPETIKQIILTHPYVLKDGKVHKNPFFIPDGQYSTEKRAFYEVKKLFDRFKNENNAEKLAHEISHQLNNQLALIMGSISLVRMENQLDNEMKALIEAAYNATNTTAQLVEKLARLVTKETKSKDSNTPML